MKTSFILRRAVAFLALAAVVQACDAPDPATRTEEGVYGASSGPNPNLADLQEKSAPEVSTGPAEAPASPQERAYPSQAGQAATPPVSEGGRASATTGATNEGQP